MTKRLFILLVVCVVLTSAAWNHSAYSWNEKVTHRDLSKFAAITFVTQNSILFELGFALGLEQELILDNTKKTIREWLFLGSELEDASSPLFPLAGTTRSLNHFHNPLKPWTEAGLDDWFIAHYTGESSLLWAQDGEKQQTIVEGDWSWQRTREYYLTALLSPTEPERQANFAKMFKGLGHIMHLIQDAAVPDHVRNDAHPEDAIMKKNLRGSKYFEAWAKKQANTINALAEEAVMPSLSFPEQGEGLAPITVLFDADFYYGTNPSASLSQGLAEYTNANFFSGDTVFAAERYATDDRHYFPFPKKSSTDLQSYISGSKQPETITGDDGKEDTAIWISKIGDGEQIEHFVRPSYLTKSVLSTLGEGATFYRTFYRDERCHEDYARHLVPRAVGYSAELLNYFFRGNIEITLPENGAYSSTDDPARGFSRIRLRARNVTPNGEEMLDGDMYLVVKYRTALEDPFQSYPVQTTEQYSYVVLPVSNIFRAIPRGEPAELIFDQGETTVIPLNATDVSLTVVYRGSLGGEREAVAVGFKDISEPTPIDLFNNTDRVCLNGQWYIAGSAEAIAQIDANQNGLADEWDIFPHMVRNVYLSVSSSAEPIPASSANYMFFTPLIEPGALYRTFILSDYGDNPFSCSNASLLTKLDARDLFIHPTVPRVYSRGCSAIKNQTDYRIEDPQECDNVGAQPPCDIRYYPLMYTFRGRNVWGPAGVVFENLSFPDGTRCSWDDLRE